MELPGQIEIVDDVPRAFARLVVRTAPRSIALSGGELAHLCYSALRNEPVDWSAVDVYFGDDRIVPLTSDDSNEGMARRVLLDGVKPRAVHSMVGSGADAYDALVRAAAPIDLVHLGLGPDGHTASLVPGDAVLDVTGADVAMTGSYQGRRRMTLTYPILNRTRRVVWVVTGSEKVEMLRRLRDGDVSIPAGRIARDQALLLADRAATGQLAAEYKRGG